MSLDRKVVGSNSADAASKRGRFLYLSLHKSLGMLLIYPKTMAVGVKPKEAFLSIVVKYGDLQLINQRVSVTVFCLGFFRRARRPAPFS